MINPAATLTQFINAQASITALVGTRIWAERRTPEPGYKPSTGAAIVLWALPGGVDYSGVHLATSFVIRCYAATDVAAYTLYAALAEALEDAHYAPMYQASLATAGQTKREPPDPTDWVFVECSFNCFFRNS